MGINETAQGKLNAPTAEAAFHDIASPLINDAIEKAAMISADPTVDGLHQFRITLRQLRSLWWSFRPLLNKGENSRQRELFRTLDDTVGKARDYDILIELIKLQQKDAGTLPAELSDARRDAMNRGGDIISSPEMKDLLLDALSQTSSELRGTNEQQHFQVFADRRVALSEKKLRKQMRRAARAKHPRVTAFHDVRKAGKKVRYLLELLEPVLSGEHRKTLNRLRKIQRKFGALNDIVASEQLLRENAALLASIGEPDRTLRWFRKERERRLRSAANLLRKGHK
jgi:CHAD domain-containing protein